MDADLKQKDLPVFDRERCTACGACISICPDQILGPDADGKPVAGGEHCLLCDHCSAVCPVGAIAVPGLTADLGLVTIAERKEGSDSAAITPEDLLGLMRKRRSCRKFRPDSPALSVLTDLVKIGTTAPSGTNSQGWQFIILPERADVLMLGEATAAFYRNLNQKAESPLYRLAARLFAGDALGNYYRTYHATVAAALQQWDESGVDHLFHGAPAAILVAADVASSCPAEDALLATQNMLLAAESLGLGTCLIGFVVEALKSDRRIAALLRLGCNERVYSVIACGYPAVTFQRPAGRKPVQPRILNLSGKGA
ncbi:MAG: nitroreductase family protein [Desulfofustis sp.]|nr:nitroreductase family protein [Desulfofustis sp.]